MPERNKGMQSTVETLSMYKVLEGLIHNINTPLNVIIGYSQQLKKQYPEITTLDSITEAGLKIDDLVSASSRHIVQRLNSERVTFDLNQWLADEVKFLNNNLEIKHILRIDLNQEEKPIRVDSNPHLLGIFIESLILHIKGIPDLASGNNHLVFATEKKDKIASIVVTIPASDKLKQNLDDYLSATQREIERCFDLVFQPGYPFEWQFDRDREVKIIFASTDK
jgi:signal transduction histidine kinase